MSRPQMIDLLNETLIPVGDVGKLPSHPSPCTIWRWRKKGVRGRTLDSVVIGGRAFTSREALARFAEHLDGTEPTPVRSPAARERAIRQAEEELKRDGIYQPQPHLTPAPVWPADAGQSSGQH